MWSRSVGDVTVVAVADLVAQSSAPSSLRSVINRALQNLSLIIFSSLFVFKIFAHPLNRYALTYCNRNATERRLLAEMLIDYPVLTVYAVTRRMSLMR